MSVYNEIVKNCIVFGEKLNCRPGVRHGIIRTLGKAFLMPGGYVM
jgi:hypothetical protein